MAFCCVYVCVSCLVSRVCVLCARLVSLRSAFCVRVSVLLECFRDVEEEHWCGGECWEVLLCWYLLERV